MIININKQKLVFVIFFINNNKKCLFIMCTHTETFFHRIKSNFSILTIFSSLILMVKKVCVCGHFSGKLFFSFYFFFLCFCFLFFSMACEFLKYGEEFKTKKKLWTSYCKKRSDSIKYRASKKSMEERVRKRKSMVFENKETKRGNHKTLQMHLHVC